MSPPRPRPTPEERVAANRAKSKRYYDREKSRINAVRRERYRARVEMAKLRVPDPSPFNDTTNIQDNPLAKLMHHASRIMLEIENLTQNVPARYVDSLYKSYTASKDVESLAKQVDDLCDLRDSILKCQGNVLNLMGVGREFHKVRSISDDVNQLTLWVEELYTIATVDSDNLQKTYEDCQFLFQCEGAMLPR